MALESQGRRFLLLHTTGVDTLVQIKQSSSMQPWVACGHPLHAVVAVSAGLVRCARLAIPQYLAVEHPEHRGIGGVVVLHGPRLAAPELVAGTALGKRDVRPCGRTENQNQNEKTRGHSTVIAAD